MEENLQILLLKLARKTLENSLLNSNHDLSNFNQPSFQVKRGLFVTLMMKGQLRGCIGRIEPQKNIYENIIDLAKAAAFNDARFSRVTAQELGKIRIEISILTLPEEIKGVDNLDKIEKVRPYIDGVIINGDGNSATFLPQVWESIADKESFFSELCRKAGLSKDYWQYDNLKIEVYQVDHFEEK